MSDLTPIAPWSSCFAYRSAMKEEEVATGARVFNRVLDKVDDGRALELGEATEAEVSCK